MDLKELEHRSDIKRHPWELARTNVVFDLIQPHLRDKNIFLDVGCGDVYFLEQVYNHMPNSKCYALDPAFSDGQLADIKSKFSDKNLFVYKDAALLNQELKQKVDFVFLMDVIEHIEEDESFLTNLVNQPYITSETIFVITVPAYQFLFASHDVFLGHYRRYTNTFLKRKIKISNLQTVQCGYFFMSLLLPRFIQKCKEKLIKPNEDTTGLVEWQGGNFISNLMQSFLYFDYKMGRLFKPLGINLPGLSNYILCKKSA